ncbi:unnamed protein product [Spirodela intermedia]|uniref:Uncharacterized protein n=1 Tax=Spirodela intermedia TaxID=51605 RepID=A0A7I8L393_SPIIN|nr:unnamed protein product [Spirodela intermedia]
MLMESDLVFGVLSDKPTVHPYLTTLFLRVHLS